MKNHLLSSWKDFFLKCAEKLLLQCLPPLSQSFLFSHRVVGVVLSAYCIHVNMIFNIVQINSSAHVRHINIYLIICLVQYAFYKPLATCLNMCLDPADFF